MKKVLLVIFLILLTINPLMSVSLKEEARGRAVLTVDDPAFAFTENPALIETKGFAFNLPITANLYSASDILKSNLLHSLIHSSEMDSSELANNILDILRNFYGRTHLITLDEMLSFSIRGFGLSASSYQRVNVSGGSLSTALSLEVGVKLSSILSFNFDFGRDSSLSVGFMPSATYRMQSSEFSIESATNMLLNKNIESSLLFYEGINLALDIGTLLKIPYGFSFALVLRDITPSYELISQTGDRISYSSPFSIDTAIGWGGNWSFVSFDLELGLRGVNNIRNNVDLLKSFNLGLSLGLTRFFEISAGLRAGYPSVGLSIDIFYVEINAAYYWQDFGIVYGLNPRDVLAIEIAISI